MQNYRRFWQYSLLLLSCTFLFACKNDYVIELPAEDSVNTSPPQFKITYEEAPTQLPAITLNGFDIREFFSSGETEATAAGTDVAVYLKQGINNLQVAPPGGPKAKFIYDTDGPEIIVLNSQVDTLAAIDGLGIDEMDLATLFVNSIAADTPGLNSFSVMVPAESVYTYVATDSLGHERTSYYSALGSLYSPAMTVAVSQQVLDTASSQLLNALSDLDINAILAGTLLFDGTWSGPSGEIYGPEVILQTIDLTADSAGIDLENGNGGLIHSASVAQSQVMFRVHNGFLPPLELVADTQIGPVTMNANLVLNVVDQVLDVVIQDFAFSMGNVTSSGIPAPFDAWVDQAFAALASVISGILSPQLEFLFEQAVPLMLESAIQNSYSINIPDYYTTHNLAMSLQLDGVYTTESALYANLAGGSIPEAPNPLVSQPTAGVIYKPDPLPGAQLDGGQFGFSLNSNTMNQVYASAYSAGLNHMNFVAGEVQLGLPRDSDFGGAGATQRTIVNPVTAPQVHVAGSADSASLRFFNYGLEIISQSRPEGGEYQDSLGVKLTTDTAIAVGLNADSSIDIQFPYAPQYTIEAIKQGTGEWQAGGQSDTINQWIESVIGLVLHQLVEPLVNIQLPTFQCVNFEVTNISAVGNEHSHLNFAGAITGNQELCGDPEPVNLESLSYGRGSFQEPVCTDTQDADNGLCYQSCGEDYVGQGSSCYPVQEQAGIGQVDLAPGFVGDELIPAEAGGKPDACLPGQELMDGLCYARCDSGYRGAGASCIAQREKAYARKGLPPEDVFKGECKGNLEKAGGLCYVPCANGYSGNGATCTLILASYDRGRGVLPSVCEPGEIRRGKRCLEPCPDGQIRAGNRCVAVGGDAIDRGAGTAPALCAEGYELSGDRCYRECREGFIGRGELCVPLSAQR